MCVCVCVCAASELRAFAALVHDRMTEEVYASPVASFRVTDPPAPVFTVPVVKEGRAALERINQEMGLAFDDWDLEYYTGLFRCVCVCVCACFRAHRHVVIQATRRLLVKEVG